MFKHITVIFCGVLLTCAALAAEGKKYTGDDYKAAYACFEAMGMAENMEKSINIAIDNQLRRNRQLAPCRHVLVAFFRKYAGYEAVKERMAEIYLSHYTPDELRELTAFYRTPVGRKCAELATELVQAGAKLGESVVKEHAHELQAELIRELADIKAKELEKKQTQLDAANAAVKDGGAESK